MSTQSNVKESHEIINSAHWISIDDFNIVFDKEKHTETGTLKLTFEKHKRGLNIYFSGKDTLKQFSWFSLPIENTAFAT